MTWTLTFYLEGVDENEADQLYAEACEVFCNCNGSHADCRCPVSGMHPWTPRFDAFDRIASALWSVWRKVRPR